jgi:hypothetical protein
MKPFDAAVAAIRTFAIGTSTHGVQRFYVYRRAEVKGGMIPDTALIFFNRGRAEKVCDQLNANAVIDAMKACEAEVPA